MPLSVNKREFDFPLKLCSNDFFTYLTDFNYAALTY